MNSSLFLGSTPAKKTEVAAQCTPHYSLHIFTNIHCIMLKFFLLSSGNPKLPMMRTHLRWVKSSRSGLKLPPFPFHDINIAAMDLDAGSLCARVCVLWIPVQKNQVSNWVLLQTNYVTSDLFQCGMFWMSVRRSVLPTHLQYEYCGDCLPVAIFNITRDTICKCFHIYIVDL